jgi:hypothetical protein
VATWAYRAATCLDHRFTLVVLVLAAACVGTILCGADGSSVSVLGKMPVLDVSLSGELNAYGRRLLTRIVVCVPASLIGCALLAWVCSLSQSKPYTDALNGCTVYPAANGAVLKTAYRLERGNASRIQRAHVDLVSSRECLASFTSLEKGPLRPRREVTQKLASGDYCRTIAFIRCWRTVEDVWQTHKR